jgi:UDP-glucose 4-epimerase
MARLSEPVEQPAGRRVLITGLSTQLGGRLAEALERDPDVEAVIGVDAVYAESARRPLERIIAAANIDTVLDTRLLADPLLAPASHIHEVNVLGTQQLLAACSHTDSTVRRLVFKSSAHAYGWDPSAPAFITEEMMPGAARRTGLERAIMAAEGAVNAFAARRPECRVAVVRLADELGGEGRTSLTALLSLPAIPAILGFDPRWQVIHLDDAVGVLAHAATTDLHGIYNAAGDGVLVLSEIASLLGRPLLPVLPPWGTAVAAAALRPLGLKMPAEMLRRPRARQPPAQGHRVQLRLHDPGGRDAAAGRAAFPPASRLGSWTVHRSHPLARARRARAPARARA